ncbi:hypothetical protein BE17_19325 [Sorangium cellulosum]|uniref:Uncharacterized protein n=1 Tax=Sorangium cellulosum TaxID=56 RepID=A0A150RHY5_SORCE|nr:hypothetical protein BE17_19325 [Sorangium cellulosum]
MVEVAPSLWSTGTYAADACSASSSETRPADLSPSGPRASARVAPSNRRQGRCDGVESGIRFSRALSRLSPQGLSSPIRRARATFAGIPLTMALSPICTVLSGLGLSSVNHSGSS